MPKASKKPATKKASAKAKAPKITAAAKARKAEREKAAKAAEAVAEKPAKRQRKGEDAGADELIEVRINKAIYPDLVICGLNEDVPTRRAGRTYASQCEFLDNETEARLLRRKYYLIDGNKDMRSEWWTLASNATKHKERYMVKNRYQGEPMPFINEHDGEINIPDTGAACAAMLARVSFSTAAGNADDNLAAIDPKTGEVSDDYTVKEVLAMLKATDPHAAWRTYPVDWKTYEHPEAVANGSGVAIYGECKYKGEAKHRWIVLHRDGEGSPVLAYDPRKAGSLLFTTWQAAKLKPLALVYYAGDGSAKETAEARAKAPAGSTEKAHGAVKPAKVAAPVCGHCGKIEGGDRFVVSPRAAQYIGNVSNENFHRSCLLKLKAIKLEREAAALEIAHRSQAKVRKAITAPAPKASSKKGGKR